MAPSGIRPTARLGRASLLAIAAGLLLAACSGSAATSGPGAAATTPPSATPVASTTATLAATPMPTKGPATQNLTIAGPAGASGAVSLAAIRCNLPPTDGTSGLQISVLGRPTDPNLSVYIFVSPGNVTVRYDSGSGATYVERDFAGTGVTGFDAATGAQIDSPLTEVPNKDAHARRPDVDQRQHRLRQSTARLVDTDIQRTHSQGSPQRRAEPRQRRMRHEQLRPERLGSGHGHCRHDPHRNGHVHLARHLYRVPGWRRVLSQHGHGRGHADRDRCPHRW